MGNVASGALEVVSESTLSMSKEMEYDEQIRDYQKEQTILSLLSERHITSKWIFDKPFLKCFHSKISCRTENCMISYDIINKKAKVIHLPIGTSPQLTQHIHFVNEKEFILFSYMKFKMIYYTITKQLKNSSVNLFNEIPFMSTSDFSFENIEEYECVELKVFEIGKKIFSMRFYNDMLYVNVVPNIFQVFNLKTLELENQVIIQGYDRIFPSNNIYYSEHCFMYLEDLTNRFSIDNLKHVSIDGTKLVTFKDSTGIGEVYNMESFKRDKSSLCSFMTLDEILDIKFTDNSENIVLLSKMTPKNQQFISVFSIESQEYIFRTSFNIIFWEFNRINVVGDFILIEKNYEGVGFIFELKLPHKFKKFEIKKGMENIQFNFH
jgi:hypothetical protein